MGLPLDFGVFRGAGDRFLSPARRAQARLRAVASGGSTGQRITCRSGSPSSGCEAAENNLRAALAWAGNKIAYPTICGFAAEQPKPRGRPWACPTWDTGRSWTCPTELALAEVQAPDVA